MFLILAESSIFIKTRKLMLLTVSWTLRSYKYRVFMLIHLFSEMILHYGDMTDGSRLSELIRILRPSEVYNLAAQSHVKVSFELSEYTSNVDGLGSLRILNAIKDSGIQGIKFYQASTSELYGGMGTESQNEKTPFYPRSPYGM